MTVTLTRRRPPAPYDFLPPVPSLTVLSQDMTDGQRIDDAFTGLGSNVSPHLQWADFPEETQSFAVTCFDPDAPSPSGFWHWTILDLDVSVTELAQGVGASDLMLDGAAFHVRNDSGTHAWTGPYPPAGDGDHRYYFAVHALDAPTLGLDDEATATQASLAIVRHTLARGILTVTYSIPGTEPGTFLKDEQ